MGAILFSGWIKTLSFIVLAPMIGLFLAFFLMVSVTWMFRRWRPSRLDHLFRRLQLVSAGLYSLGHGGNDAQKTMGIIWMLLIAANVFLLRTVEDSRAGHRSAFLFIIDVLSTTHSEPYHVRKEPVP